MRKILTLALLAATVAPLAVSAAANAQSREEVRDSYRDQQHGQRDMRDAQRHDARDDIRDERRDVRDERRDIRDERRDVRGDWRDYREHNRREYARGNWRAPFRYQRWHNGSVLRPYYFAPRYYINDYDRYRLPPPGRGLRWIRHYDDVLLVNIYNGRIIQIYYSFFW